MQIPASRIHSHLGQPRAGRRHGANLGALLLTALLTPIALYTATSILFAVAVAAAVVAVLYPLVRLYEALAPLLAAKAVARYSAT